MNKRLLGLVVGAAAMALTQMTPAQASSQSRNYVAGSTVKGNGVTFNTPAAAPASIGGASFDGPFPAGGNLKVTITDASGRVVAANVSFRGDPVATDPTGEIMSINQCTAVTNTTIPTGTKRVIVFIQWHDNDLGYAGCGTGKTTPPTTGSIKLDY